MAIKRVGVKENYRIFKAGFAVDFDSGINVIIGGNGVGKTTLLKHINSCVTFITEKQTGFGFEYEEILIKAQDVPTKKQSEMQQKIRNTIVEIIGGEIEYDVNGGEFVTIRTDGTRIPFAAEASGFKKLGLLGLLVKCGQLESGSLLFWDEPENSLNPELMPKLVDILFELQRNGVQIFLATHSYTLARYFDVIKDRNAHPHTPYTLHAKSNIHTVLVCDINYINHGHCKCVFFLDAQLVPAAQRLFKRCCVDLFMLAGLSPQPFV